MSTATDLSIITSASPTALYKDGGMKALLDELEKEVKSHVIDCSTVEGRKFCASLAYKVARAKTTLDAMGKDLVDDWKRMSKLVDAERKLMRDRLDALKEEVRKPLTEFEEREKNRVADHQRLMEGIVVGSDRLRTEWQTLDPVTMRNHLNVIDEWEARDWEEFDAEAKSLIASAREVAHGAIAQREKYDAEQAELKRLREEAKEAKAREQREREIREAEERSRLAAAEAVEKARKDAEAAKEQEIKLERLKLEQEKFKAEQELKRAQREAEEALARAKQAEALAEAAAKAERERLEAEQRQAEEAAKHRREIREHVEQVNSEAIQALVQLVPLDIETAGKVVRLIADGHVTHVMIHY